MAEELPPPVDAEPALKPVMPPPGSPDYQRRNGADASGAVESTAPAEVSKPHVPPLVAALEFSDPRSKVVPITHRFTFDGRTFSEVTLRRLSMVAVDKLVDERRHGDLYEVISEMTSVPAAVLRGMDADDGDRLVAESRDFLPRILREAFGLQ
jgi:hypothetical protein